MQIDGFVLIVIVCCTLLVAGILFSQNVTYTTDDSAVTERKSGYV